MTQEVIIRCTSQLIKLKMTSHLIDNSQHKTVFESVNSTDTELNSDVAAGESRTKHIATLSQEHYFTLQNSEPFSYYFISCLWSVDCSSSGEATWAVSCWDNAFTLPLLFILVLTDFYSSALHFSSPLSLSLPASCKYFVTPPSPPQLFFSSILFVFMMVCPICSNEVLFAFRNLAARLRHIPGQIWFIEMRKN